MPTPSPEATPAQTAKPTPAPVSTPAPASADALPVVINRADKPAEWTDFAFPEDAELLKIYFPPIRDCDATLLTCGGETLLIDCGSHEFEKSIAEMLRELGIRSIDRLLITHPHHDHYEALALIVENVQIGELWVSFPDDYNEHSLRIRRWADTFGIPLRRYGDGDVLTLGGATLTVYDRCPENYSCNDRSAQILLRYGGRTMYFSSDLEVAGMRTMAAVAGEGEIRADILKYPHHGKPALERAFADAVQPLFCVVTGKDRGWSGEIWLTWNHMPYINTRICGVVLTTDGGGHWLVEHFYADDDPRGH